MLSSIFYHVFVKLIPANANPAVSLAVAYLTSLILCAGLLFLYPVDRSIIQEIKKLYWATVGLALALVGLELGFLLAYRAGWKISTAAIIVNVAATLLLVPVGMLLFKQKLSPINMVGIVVCVAGLVMVNMGR